MPDYTAIFTRLGAFARIHRQCFLLSQSALAVSESGSTLRTPLDIAETVRESFSGTGDTAALAAIDRLTRFAGAAQGAWNSIRPLCDAWLSGPLAADLGAANDTASALAALARAMRDDDETIQESAMGLSAPTADPANTGSGTCHASLLTLAAGSGTPHASQLAREQSMEAVCTADSLLDGVAEGREVWLLRAPSGGSATMETIPVTSGDAEDPVNLVTDGSFTEYAEGEFANFTATGSGVFSQEATETRFDAVALRIEGDADGVAALAQVISDRDTPVPGGDVLALAVHRKSLGVTAGSITVRLSLNGTPLDGSITIDDGTATGAWAHELAWVAVPKLSRSDLLTLECAVSADYSGAVILDGLSLASATVIDGVRCAIFQGVRSFARSPYPDRFTIASNNDGAGAFAAFLRDVYGAELPASATPTIDDGLAV